jgi:hypothetical protein
MVERLRVDTAERVTKRRLVRRVVLALVLAIIGADLASAQTLNASAAYDVDAMILGPNPDSARLCTGERANIQARIRRLIYDGGPEPAINLVGGGRVVAEIGVRKVGHFETYGPNRQGVSEPEAPRYALAQDVGPVGHALGAQYVFVADAPGTTQIDFFISATGEEPFGANWPRRKDSVEITVVDCFEAFTSGLGLTFPVADMKDLIQPFTLESVSQLTSGRVVINTKDQAMFFMPIGNRQSFTPSPGGLFVMSIAETFQTAERQVTCLEVIVGSYAVKFHITPNDRRYRSGIDVGNLRLNGSATRWCDGQVVGSAKYADPQNPGWLIAFKPKLVPPPFVPESR